MRRLEKNPGPLRPTHSPFPEQGKGGMCWTYPNGIHFSFLFFFLSELVSPRHGFYFSTGGGPGGWGLGYPDTPAFRETWGVPLGRPPHYETGPLGAAREHLPFVPGEKAVGRKRDSRRPPAAGRPTASGRRRPLAGGVRLNPIANPVIGLAIGLATFPGTPPRPSRGPHHG